ncbi:SDR family NAD(P)-dependent oxidoreductase [Flavobacterium psychrophilum]|uniref:SDR family NAD(P)-dependent oxidoreductase n=1 Tax=Flavobacterium psychrophilum TaxID=96345 RepID=UPI001D08456F|nr:SDR family NAD(P)-dependent oxidoreductase [Flavobacterium psychrophilum]ELV7525524.1 SDR family NAD(P)-dependent oxidoreductase [Flavobacterium psychrophilum]MCB6098851.1 SDR family NAD(P)-dependent oxidoreductase [Flavobacterium psychrophilum]
MKNVLITGAGSGLGKALALHFSKNGWNVIATMIHLDHGKEIMGLPNISCHILDVTSTEIIENAKTELLQKYKTIDVVINNAGVGYRSFVELSEDDKIESIVNINWLGVVKVCRTFIPVFRAQNHGLFINISSVAGLVNLPLGSFYHSTKKAVESFSECMAYELIDFNIKVCTVQFGNAKTNFQANVTKSEKSEIESYNNLMDKITNLLHKKTAKNKDLLPTITQKILSIAQNPPRRFKRFTIGFDANAISFLRRILGYRLFNSIIRRSVLK